VERAFLQLLTSSTDSTSSSVRVMEGQVRCLAALLRIDHRVAGRCLPRLLALLALRYALSSSSSSSSSSYEKDQDLRRACLRTVNEATDTYARLRQVGALLQALLSLEERDGVGAEAAAAARALVADAEVRAALGRAIRGCPPPQFVPLWDALAGQGGDAEEAKEKEEAEEEEAATTRRLGEGGVRYGLLSLLLAHVRVSALNAPALGLRAAGVMARVRTPFGFLSMCML
jgi:hypothetical protein